MDGGTVVLLKLTTAMEIDNMSKFNKSDFPLLFATVSKVLGDEEANKQLSIAYKSSGGKDWEDFTDLSACFYWDDTSQGSEYWLNVLETCEGVSYE